MGSRSAGETVIAILVAFLEQRSWSQSELAARVGVGVPVIRKHLVELSRHIPLESERDHPHVVWSVPHNWFPGGVTVPSADVLELLRQLARAPQSDRRDHLILGIATASHLDRPMGITPVAHPADDNHLRIVEDACTRRIPLTMRYYSARSGHVDDRVVSVQRVLVGPFHRFLAHCHASDALRYFRVSRIQLAALEPSATFVAASPQDVEAFLVDTVAGYRDPRAPVFVAFTVRDPEARWVKDTLPVPMHVEPDPSGGVRVSSRTAGVGAIARFVVGLGDAARPETPELIAAVHDLAQGALLATSPTIRSVTTNRSIGSTREVP